MGDKNSWGRELYGTIKQLHKCANEVACWSEDGRMIVIKNSAEFTRSYGRYMPGTNDPKWESIVKQLNNYGFKRAHPNQYDQYIVFEHESGWFLRDDESHLDQIQKKEKNVSTEKKVANLEEENQELQQKVRELEQRVQKLEQNKKDEAKESAADCMSMEMLSSGEVRTLVNNTPSRSSEVSQEIIYRTSTSPNHGTMDMQSVLDRLTSLEEENKKMRKEIEMLYEMNTDTVAVLNGDFSSMSLQNT
mmetsp:Transcript_19799/g.27172  ORF Transcript_19799/g.27172 Transcript_19799/m.27172 type:complete len:247 (-) Transcript_19799:528-1268(-)|eukprot:CAMPEP_0185729330 /NCGR_PEP_ID=MMETSP1171-20130828/5099_1 /TAXON_ID=374046 /ORGANISM="Helicotheca tamensis, Strain CCMP826" /LENGTH=246 /DNA_ID=CAMNT_0028398139 /DNA_START=51 /DNA_END=791 /DNA_ORIENTATION=-